MTQREYNKLFVGGDLSGIQKFLYNITSRHASVSLKGRSFFLSNYLRKVCNRIEDTVVGLGETFEELYCSGGKFYLITDNTYAVREAIDDCAEVFKKELWNEYRGQLGINISHVAYREENGKFYVEGHKDEQNFSSGVLWKYCNADFIRQKNQKFRALLLSHPNSFFGFKSKNEDGTDNEDFQDLVVGKNHKVCALTGVDFDISKLPKGAKYTIDDDKSLFYLPSAIEQINVGEKLRKKEGFKTFEEYADGSYLGVLRMDVDGMGKRFIIGFPTFDDYMRFSEKTRKFFEEDIKNKLLVEKIQEGPEKGMEFKQFLNIIYAGGDDLFIVGRWDKVIDFAKLIHDRTIEEFKNESYIDVFNPNKPQCHISISGGVAVVKPKFPIAKAAELAGEAEEAAKQGAKDAFNLFGKTISWNKNKTFAVIEGKSFNEYAYVEYYKNKFVGYILKFNKDYGFGKSILHKIMLYSEIADMNIERESKGKPKNYSYMWHISYYMTRFMEKFKGYEKESNEQKKKIKKELYDFCCDLRNKQLPNSRSLELIALAARWAELILKDVENNN